jgi:hypothetical protein
MKMLIINTEIAEKLRNTEFDGFNRLDPIKGELDGKEVYFLQDELKENKIFAKALTDFEVCEVKDTENFETKYFDTNGIETTFENGVLIKTILKLKAEPTLFETLGKGIVDGATAVWNGIVYVWDSITGWFKS